MTTVSRRRYSAEFKAQAVGLVNNGKSVPEVALELEISDGVLYAWVRQENESAQLGSGGSRAVGERSAADELRRLRREIANLKLENDILKKAAIIFATKPQPRPGQ